MAPPFTRKMRALAMGSAVTYPVGRIAGEVAVFYIQSPVIGDRSSILQTICTQWGGGSQSSIRVHDEVSLTPCSTINFSSSYSGPNSIFVE